MKSAFLIFIVTLLSLCFSATSSTCYCHTTLVGLNKLWKQFGCNTKQNYASNYPSFSIEKLEDSVVFEYHDIIGKTYLPDFKDANCNYLFHLFKFDSGQQVGKNWEGKVSARD